MPTSGHPGGSISSGRFVAGDRCSTRLDYDLADPDRQDADVLSYAAGHKAMGLYAMWALRDEIARARPRPSCCPATTATACVSRTCSAFAATRPPRRRCFAALHARALDGHPTPATPFVRLATGASGVGLASSIGLAIGARDRFGADCPRIHISEGEGGLTPGRVSEALAAAGTASLGNVVVHLDWNQASIDSDHVCREGDVPGDYVQWDPGELFYLHDWNVVQVAGRPRLPAGRGRPAPRAGDRQRPAHRGRSTARARVGSTASKAGPRTAPGTSSALPASTRRWPS